MKVTPNRPPAIFKGFSGTAEVNLRDFVTAYPNQRIVIKNMLSCENNIHTDLNFDNPEYIARFTLFDGEYIRCEVGYPTDRWCIQRNENTKVFSKEDFK